MKVINSIDDYQGLRKSLIGDIGFVPTMGALHQGHLALIKQSLRENDYTVASIFVNPTQFNRSEDYKNYPRDYQSDLLQLEKIGVDVVLLPTEEEMYPLGKGMLMKDGDEFERLEGSNRPGHFDGVLTVVLKLFNIVRPTHAYFGLKDFQQYKLIKDMAKNYFLPVKVKGVETVRDDFGLALSSRNFRLDEEGINLARQVTKIFLNKKLNLNEVQSELEKIKQIKLDYLEDYQGRRFFAYFIGQVRLIDNYKLGESDD